MDLLSPKPPRRKGSWLTAHEWAIIAVVIGQLSVLAAVVAVIWHFVAKYW